MSYLKNIKWEMILFSIISIVIGTLMWKYPDKIITALSIAIASIFFIIGIRFLIEYKRKGALGGFFKYDLVIGVVMFVGGIFVLACMKYMISIVTYLIAIIVIISGLMKVENALDLKKMRCNWVTLMVFAVMCILLGISVLMMPMNENDNGSRTAGDFMIQCAGIIFAVTGLIDLITTLTVSGKIKEWVMERRTMEIDVDIVDEE